MAKEIDAEEVAKRTFVVMMVGVALYVLAVGVFVLGSAPSSVPAKDEVGRHD